MLAKLVEYWPVLLFTAQLMTCLVVVWLDARTDRKVKAAIDPVDADLTALETRVTKIEVRLQDIEGDLGDRRPGDLAQVEGE